MALFDDPPLRDFPNRAIRELLKNLANLAELLADIAPQLAILLDCSRAVLLQRGFVLEDWRERESDLFFQVPLRHAEPNLTALVCILLEHQSAADPVMPLRLLVYAAMHWEQEWKAWEDRHTRGEPLRLSPIIPIVFHTGSTPWHTNRELHDLIPAPAPFREFAPHWPPLFYDLAERPAEQLLNGSSKLLQALAVVRAEREDADSFGTILQEVLRRLEPLHDREPVRWRDLMWFVLSWAVRRRSREERDRLRELIEASRIESSQRKELVAMSQSTHQTWDDWVAEQLVEREARGQMLAYRETLRDLLNQRFQTVPETLLQRIEATTDVQRLKAAIAQVLQIQSPNELTL